MHVEPEELHANRRSHPEDIWTVLRHGARQGRITHMARLEGKDPWIFAQGTPKWNLNKNPVKDIPIDIAFFVFCTRFLAIFPHMWELPHWICLSFRCCKGSSKCSSSSSGTFGSMSRGSSTCSLLYRSRCPRDTAWYGVCHSKSSEWTQVSSIRCKSTALFAEICVTELLMTEVYPAPAVKSNMLKHVRGT